MLDNSNLFVSGVEVFFYFPFIVKLFSKRLGDSPSIIINITFAAMKRLKFISSHNVEPCTISLYTSLYQSGANICTILKKSLKALGNKEIGGARRDRTVDLYAASVALSQLSYGPKAYKHDTQAARI